FSTQYFCTAFSCFRYLAHGSSQKSVAMSYCHSTSFASRNLRETSAALRKVLEPLYMPVPTQEMWEKIAQGFSEHWNFPNCVGAIDGKHIAVEGRGSATFNYKKTHSIILLAVVDASYKFVMVDIGEYGSWNDSGVFRECPFGQKMMSGTLQLPCRKALPRHPGRMPFVLVGDEAFPLMENLMRPFPGEALDLPKKCFNYRLSRARRISENAFGILAARWRLFRQAIQGDLSLVDNLVWSGVLLHNYMRTCDDEEGVPMTSSYARPANVDCNDAQNANRQKAAGQENPSLSFRNLEPITSGHESLRGQKVRQAFANYFCSTMGEVSWQYDQVSRGSRRTTL
ncbi:unnamed protein product, partial [Ixodes pacificus]